MALRFLTPRLFRAAENTVRAGDFLQFIDFASAFRLLTSSTGVRALNDLLTFGRHSYCVDRTINTDNENAGNNSNRCIQ